MQARAAMLAVAVMVASWYGPGFHGRTAANGSTYDMHAMTAAHTSLPFGTVVRLWRNDPRVSVMVTITDRGPYCFEALSAGHLAPHPTRDIDLSRAAFKALAPLGTGVMKLRAETYLPGEPLPAPGPYVSPPGRGR